MSGTPQPQGLLAAEAAHARGATLTVRQIFWRRFFRHRLAFFSRHSSQRFGCQGTDSLGLRLFVIGRGRRSRVFRGGLGLRFGVGLRVGFCLGVGLALNRLRAFRRGCLFILGAVQDRGDLVFGHAFGQVFDHFGRFALGGGVFHGFRLFVAWGRGGRLLFCRRGFGQRGQLQAEFGEAGLDVGITKYAADCGDLGQGRIDAGLRISGIGACGQIGDSSIMGVDLGAQLRFDAGLFFNSGVFNGLLPGRGRFFNGRGFFRRRLLHNWFFGDGFFSHGLFLGRGRLGSRFLGGGLFRDGFFNNRLFNSRLFGCGFLSYRFFGRRLFGRGLFGNGFLNRGGLLNRGRFLGDWFFGGCCFFNYGFFCSRLRAARFYRGDTFFQACVAADDAQLGLGRLRRFQGGSIA